MRVIFVGPNGIRAGWRLAIYLILAAAIVVALTSFARPLVYESHRGGVVSLQPWFGLLADLPIFIAMLAAAYVMSRIERRPMSAYGLPWRYAFGGRFWQGILVGFVSLTCVLGVILAFHGWRIEGLTPVTPGVAIAGAAYALTFLCVAFTEEFFFRGYAQSTLTQGIGFWPAAGLLSMAFAAVHSSNSGESVFGVAQVVIFALVFCYVLMVTGSLWFAVGYHAAWDWGETFFYGVPNSGQQASVSLVHGALDGPAWLTGGTVGPEGSILTTLALLLLLPLVNALSKRPQIHTGASIQER